jgi:hypothetical protein
MFENECVKAGCNASCCHDIFFTLSMGKRKILEAFPQAQQTGFFKIYSDKLSPGVYHNWGMVRIVGPCPNLSEVDCLLKYKSARPEVCNSFDRGCDECISSRRRDEKKIR